MGARTRSRRVLAGLAPARVRGYFVAQTILGADERTLAEVRRAVAALPSG